MDYKRYLFFKRIIRRLIIISQKLYYTYIFLYIKMCGKSYILKPNSVWEHSKKNNLIINESLPGKEYTFIYESSILKDNQITDGRRITKPLLPCYTVEMDNAIVVGEDTDLIIHNKEILTDRFHYSPTDKNSIVLQSPFFKNSVAGSLIFAEKIHKNLKNGIFLNTRWSANIYHFIYDIMLKLQWIEHSKQYANYPIILGPNSLNDSSRIEILKRINTNRHEIIILEKNKNYRVNNLLVSTVEHFFINEQYINGALWYGGFYRQDSLYKFRKYWPSSNKTGTGKYFLIRPKNDRLINESEIAEYFRGKGFEIINPGLYSYEEQVSIFQKAKWIVATHGASLCNIVHCPSNTIVVQIVTEPILQNLDYNNLGFGIDISVINVCGELISHDNSWTAIGIKMKLKIDDADKIYNYLCSTDQS